MGMIEQKIRGTFWFLWHHLILLTKPVFQPFPISSTLQLPHFCYKPISVIHIWKAYDVYFLNFIVSRALFSKKTSLLGGFLVTSDFWPFSAVSVLFHDNAYFSDIWTPIMLQNGSFWSLCPCHDSRHFKQ